MSQGGWYLFFVLIYLSIFFFVNLMMLHLTTKKIVDRCGNSSKRALREQF